MPFHCLFLSLEFDSLGDPILQWSSTAGLGGSPGPLHRTRKFTCGSSHQGHAMHRDCVLHLEILWNRCRCCGLSGGSCPLAEHGERSPLPSHPSPHHRFSDSSHRYRRHGLKSFSSLASALLSSRSISSSGFKLVSARIPALLLSTARRSLESVRDIGQLSTGLGLGLTSFTTQSPIRFFVSKRPNPPHFSVL
jgi:hypothetical protein